MKTRIQTLTEELAEAEFAVRSERIEKLSWELVMAEVALEDAKRDVKEAKEAVKRACDHVTEMKGWKAEILRLLNEEDRH